MISRVSPSVGRAPVPPPVLWSDDCSLGRSSKLAEIHVTIAVNNAVYIAACPRVSLGRNHDFRGTECEVDHTSLRQMGMRKEDRCWDGPASTDADGSGHSPAWLIGPFQYHTLGRWPDY